jgi:hypothetical protein
MLQTLTRISRPTGAVAVVNQGHCLRPTPSPRGMSLDNRCVKKRTQAVPKSSASDHLGVMLKGFLAARTVAFAEEAAEVPMMLASENQELVDATFRVVPPDDSLPPRLVAVTLLAYGGTPEHCNGVRVYLDALAHLASSPLGSARGDQALGASLVRMSLMAGVDARWFAGQIAASCLNGKPAPECDGVDLCVRWAVPGGTGMLRSEVVSLPTGLSLDAALQRMQNVFLSMKISYETPFNDDITTLHHNVPTDAWAQSVHDTSHEFFALMEGKPCVYKGEVLQKHEGKVSVEATGVFVRICPRNEFDPVANAWRQLPVERAVHRSDVFHAFLIGNSAYQQDIERHCRAHETEGLTMPDSETRAFCLHTCAVQASGFPLKERVSLYATHPRGGGRRPGKPICSPGSWVWRLESAIVAIEHVLANFYVIPCSRESVLPADKKLETPFNEFFNRAYKLYVETFGRAPLHQAAQDSGERFPIVLPSQPMGGDPAIRAAENYALTAFGLDATTQRIAVGDAYSMLRDRKAPHELANLMLQSALRMGIGTSVLDAMGKAAEAIRVLPADAPLAAQQLRGECTRLKRIADAALHVSNKRQRPISSPVDMEAGRVKSLLSAAGLRKGGDSKIEARAKGQELKWQDYSEAVSTVASCLLRAPCESTVHQHACEVAKAAHVRSWKDSASAPSSGVGNAAMAAAAATAVLRACEQALPSTVFVVSQIKPGPGRAQSLAETRPEGARPADCIRFSRVTPGGGLEPTTPGVLVDTPLRAVLLVVQTEGSTAARVTATVPV